MVCTIKRRNLSLSDSVSKDNTHNTIFLTRKKKCHPSEQAILREQLVFKQHRANMTLN